MQNQAQRLGIAETRELILFIAAFGSTAGSVLADGKVTLPELIGFSDAAFKLKPAIDGIREVPSELADLDTEERASIIQELATRLQLPWSRAEAIAEEAFAVALPLVAFILKLALLKKDPA